MVLEDSGVDTKAQHKGLKATAQGPHEAASAVRQTAGVSDTMSPSTRGGKSYSNLGNWL